MVKSRKVTHPLAPRIKRMMQTDDEVGKIAQPTPVLIGRACELFVQKLCSGAATIASGKEARTLTPAHIKAYVSSDANMDFLLEVVSHAPDLAPGAEGAEGAPKAKRARKSGDAAPAGERGRGRGRGGGQGRGRAVQDPDLGSEPAAPAVNSDRAAPAVAAAPLHAGSESGYAGAPAGASAAAAEGLQALGRRR
ncbi:hypothetical protein WJX81_002563 [Elliptochloris bilobata]|uniref:Transcription factor CBF/NF-Y/archaeal histone domain-containing protein n=1 Tax=Elliptochloris bilobata TaxID=381761 RepID=A0AAW1QLL9_9CHLO